MSHALAAIFHGAQAPHELKSLPLPRLKQHELLVKIEACTLCGSDLHSYTGKRRVPSPTILGHEILGTIVELGGGQPTTFDHQPLKIGDRITWSIIANCGHCLHCIHDRPQKCLTLFKYGHQVLHQEHLLHGGLAEYCHLTAQTPVFLAPKALSDEILCPANCATATVMAAFNKAGTCANKTVLIQGCGVLGLTACSVAKTQGATLIIASDTDPRRLELARTFGADHCFTSQSSPSLPDTTQELTQGVGIQLVLECSGSQEAMTEGLKTLAIGGHYVLVGAVFPGPQLNFMAETMIKRLVTISGSHNYRPQDLQEAVQFLDKHHQDYPFQDFITKSFPLSQINEAFEYAKNQRPLRLMIRPHGHDSK